MATKPEAEADAGAAPPKSKKMLLIIVIAVVVLALAGVGGWLFLSKQHAADAAEEEEDVAAVQTHQGPPVYLPLEHMVVNLADPGGERVAQVGITFQLAAPEDVERVKAYLPSIRNDILLLISQRTADDLLKVEGKEQLAAEIQQKAASYFGKSNGGKKGDKKGAKKSGNPIQGVLFSSLIVQ